eukprot:Ihof_evm1s88 gene=Ihof_evmTU1s88
MNYRFFRQRGEGFTGGSAQWPYPEAGLGGRGPPGLHGRGPPGAPLPQAPPDMKPVQNSMVTFRPQTATTRLQETTGKEPAMAWPMFIFRSKLQDIYPTQLLTNQQENTLDCWTWTYDKVVKLNETYGLSQAAWEDACYNLIQGFKLFK